MKPFLFTLGLLMLLLAPPAAAQHVHPQYATHVFAAPGRPFAMWISDSQSTISHIRNLPSGLTWNPNKQLIEGSVKAQGNYPFYISYSLDGQQITDTVTLLVSSTLQQPVPFMGMLTWNVFESLISEDKMHLLAETLVHLGLRDAGYQYLCLDDCWALPERDSNGHLTPVPEKFPSGLRSLTDHLHALGLKAGIYSDGGTFTCSHAQPGSLGHEETDARDFALWGFDLLKYDFCYSDLDAQGSNGSTDTRWASKVYGSMRDALSRHAAHDFIFYICEWGRLNPWEWGAQAGGSCWRATDDTRDCWRNTSYKGGVMDNIEIFAQIWPYSGINRFNDADMVMCGLHGQGLSSSAGTDGRGMSMDEYRTQFILWCMWSSPLTLCFDITTLYDGHSRLTNLYNPYYQEDLALIANPDLIAIDQDPWGLCARPVRFDTAWLVLEKPLHNGTTALSYTNLCAQAQTLRLSSLPQGIVVYGAEPPGAACAPEADITLRPHQTIVISTRQPGAQHPYSTAGSQTPPAGKD